MLEVGVLHPSVEGFFTSEKLRWTRGSVSPYIRASLAIKKKRMMPKGRGKGEERRTASQLTAGITLDSHQIPATDRPSKL